MGRVLIAESDPAFVERVAAVVAGQTDLDLASVTDLAEVPGAIADQDPSVLLVGPSLAGDDAIGLTSALLAESRRTAVVFVANEVTTDALRVAMRAGVSDVIGADDGAAALLEAVREAHDAAEGARERVPDQAEPEPEHSLAKVVTVFGMKGGVGKTVLAINLATALAKSGKRTVLVDLDLQFGDCAIMLGLSPDRTVYDAIQSFDRLDEEMLEGFLMKHPSGLQVLLAPRQPEEAESVTTARIQRVLGLLRQMADYVVIDTSATFDEVVLTALDRSDTVLAMTMMDVASIKNTKISLQKLVQLGYRNGLIGVVLNRADSKVWLEPGEVEAAIGGRVRAKIPSDRVVPRSVNKGVPVVLDAPRSEVSRSIDGLARAIASES